MPTYAAVLTEYGKAQIAASLISGETLSWSKMAVGDGGGSAVTPTSEATALVNETYRADLNTLKRDPADDTQLIAELIIPPETGGWTIREAGIFDSDSHLVVYASLPETVKPILTEGSGMILTIRCRASVGSEAAVSLIIDPSVVIATVEYVDTEVAGLKNLTFAQSTWYKRPSLMSSNKTSITIPAGMQVAINGALYVTTAATTLALGDFVTAANRKGKDVYVYACVPSSGTAPTFVLSLNSTVPTGYTAATSRKIGGFHCLCVDVGTISGHTLSGYVAGDILPLSVWDLLFRAESENSGMVFVNGTWYDIYLPSYASSKVQSVYGGSILDGNSNPKMHGERFAEYAGLVSKRLIDRDEFLVIAKGSNEGTNISGNSDPNTTGGHKDTNNRRMISNYGLEDCCGALWQWTRDTWGAFNVLSTSNPAVYSNQGGINAMAQTSEAEGNHYLNGYNWQTDGRGTSNIDIDGSASLYGNAYGALVRALVGGFWSDGSICGSRSVILDHLSSARLGSSSGRLASEPRVVNL